MIGKVAQLPKHRFDDQGFYYLCPSQTYSQLRQQVQPIKFQWLGWDRDGIPLWHILDPDLREVFVSDRKLMKSISLEIADYVLDNPQIFGEMPHGYL